MHADCGLLPGAYPAAAVKLVVPQQRYRLDTRRVAESSEYADGRVGAAGLMGPRHGRVVRGGRFKIRNARSLLIGGLALSSCTSMSGPLRLEVIPRCWSVFHRRVVGRPNPAQVPAFYLHDRERMPPTALGLGQQASCLCCVSDA